jgi:hypothetical protein
VQFSCHVTIQHIANAAEAIDYPECHTCWIKKQKENGPNNPECRDDVWNMVHTGKLQLIIYYSLLLAMIKA